MKYLNSILEAIGRTPLVRVNRLVSPGMARVFVKPEFLNPGGSIKDRMAVYMLEEAEKDGRLKPGGTIIENTSGNTGVGLAMAAAAKGYRSVFTMPDKMSVEKINMLKAFGAEVIVTPTAVPHDSPESYYGVAKRLASEIPNSWYVNQYDEPNNVKAHYLTTGPEIWEQTEGEIDYLVLGAGTGGTVTGAGRYLKEKAAAAKKSLKIVVAEPEGSIVYDLFYKLPEPEPRVYKVEGIGHDYIPGCLDLTVIDEMRRVSDRDSFLTGRRLAREEGLFAGGSCGSAMWVALQLAKEVGAEKNIVVILPDSGSRYLSKMYNDAWMKDLGFLDLDERLGRVRDLLQFKGYHVEFALGDETISQVASRMSELGISQMPIRGDNGKAALMVHEVDLLQALLQKGAKANDSVLVAAHAIDGLIDPDAPISRLERIFESNNVAVVMKNEEVLGIAAKIDVVRFLATKS